MASLKEYLRKNTNPELWAFLSLLKRTGEDAWVHTLFYLRKRRGFTSVPCLVPFMRLEFLSSGKVSACCTPFTKIRSVGNMKYQTIEQIWNGKELKRFRKLLFLGKTDNVCMPSCEYLKTGPVSLSDIRTDTEEGASLHDDICNGRVKLKSHPIRFNLANFTACNLKCVMCYTRKLNQTNNSIPVHVYKTHENLRNYFDKRITIYLSGNGDVLARKDTRELLQNFDSKKYSKVTFQITTNGLLFQPAMWETISHNNFTFANISVDAATKGTYETIRRGGNWEKLQKALEVFKEAKAEEKFSNITLSMVVMRSNFREIPQFIKMARLMGFNALFTKILGEWGDENIFETKDEKTLNELKNVLSDPDLYGEDIDMQALCEYVPKEYRGRMGNRLTSTWSPALIMKSLTERNFGMKFPEENMTVSKKHNMNVYRKHLSRARQGDEDNQFNNEDISNNADA